MRAHFALSLSCKTTFSFTFVIRADKDMVWLNVLMFNTSQL